MRQLLRIESHLCVLLATSSIEESSTDGGVLTETLQTCCSRQDSSLGRPNDSLSTTTKTKTLSWLWEAGNAQDFLSTLQGSQGLQGRGVY